MFKFKAQKRRNFEIKGTYVGIIFTNNTGLKWIVLSYDNKSDTYTRSETNDRDPTMSKVYKHNKYSHSDITRYIYNKDWIIEKFYS